MVLSSKEKLHCLFLGGKMKVKDYIEKKISVSLGKLSKIRIFDNYWVCEDRKSPCRCECNLQ